MNGPSPPLPMNMYGIPQVQGPLMTPGPYPPNPYLNPLVPLGGLYPSLPSSGTYNSLSGEQQQHQNPPSV